MGRAPTTYLIGVAPGLNALAYSVLELAPGSRPRSVDHDVLHARPLSPESFTNPYKRGRIHQMVLGVVAERYPPSLLVIGPVLDPREEPAHVQASRDVLAKMAEHFRMALVSLDTRDAITAVLQSEGKSLGRAVNQLLDEPLDSRDRRIVLATAAGLAGWRLT